mmetsp:Transcript_19888/g.41855  ORF Transcript_19888/g.41855 Transcript_19888/m.41855 type:complete len:406 (+) Transcript_19888:79-1296(+)
MTTPNPSSKLGAILAAIIAVGIGLFLSTTSEQDPMSPWTAVCVIIGLVLTPLSHLQLHPLFLWITALFPSLIGILPAMTPHPSWQYTLDQFQSVDLRGQSALITGANGGIGFELSRALSRQGASVTLACRHPQRCFAAADRIRKEEGYSGAPVSPLVMDVSDLHSVRRAAKTYLTYNDGELDMLYLNAGVVVSSSEATSKDGIEMVFATNIVGHHLLYRLLEPALQKSTVARVVSTSSASSIWWMPPYGLPYLGSNKASLIPSTAEELNNASIFPLARYGRSKLAQLAWTEALTSKLGHDSNVYANVAHPGAVYTPIVAPKKTQVLPQFLLDVMVHLVKKILWSAEDGVLTLLYLGVATDEIQNKELRGRYFHPQAVEVDHPHAKAEELQENVWKLCEELVQSFL